MRLLPKDRLLRTSRVDHADWNYRPVLSCLMRQRFSLMLRLLPAGRVENLLEIGFGSGIFMPELAARCVHLYGIDVHSHVAEVQAELARHGIDAKLSRQDAARTNFPSASFDVIVAVSTLEFIEEVDAAARECARLLKPHGRLLYVMPGKSPVLDFALRAATGENAKRDYGERRQAVVPNFARHLQLVRQVSFLGIYWAYEFRRARIASIEHTA